MLTLPPCSASGTSMADPTTCTVSTARRDFQRTGAAWSSDTVLVLKPGAVTTSLAPSGASGASISKRAVDGGSGLRLHSDAAHDGDLCAGDRGAGRIDNLAFDFSGGKAGGKNKNRPTGLRRKYAFSGSSLESRSE